MCQTLVTKVAQSEQLRAVADPDILLLFEEWLTELEQEIVSATAAEPDVDPLQLVQRLGLSANGALFMVTKMRQAGKL